MLRHSNDWRGVTWHDPDATVVWLCASGWHRSGQPDDAFQLFAQLKDAGRIWSTAEDYEALAADRTEQFAAFVIDDAPRLLAMARAEPEVEHVLAIGQEPVALVVHVVETLEETFVAVSVQNISMEMCQILQVALYPERSFKDLASRAAPTYPRPRLRAIRGLHVDPSCLAVLARDPRCNQPPR